MRGGEVRTDHSRSAQREVCWVDDRGNALRLRFFRVSFESVRSTPLLHATGSFGIIHTRPFMSG